MHEIPISSAQPLTSFHTREPSSTTPLSRQDKEVKTEAARQSHYIFWCSVIGIPDLCGNKIGYQRIVTIYIKFVMCSINYYNKDVLRSSTLWGYATTVNTLFQLRGYKQPTELSNPSNMPGIIITNLIKEETVASQRSPLDSTIFAELQQAASSSHSHDSDRNLLFDMIPSPVSLDLASANMHKPPKTKSITMSTHQEHASSKRSQPMTLSSMTKVATSSKKSTAQHPTQPHLCR